MSPTEMMLWIGFGGGAGLGMLIGCFAFWNRLKFKILENILRKPMGLQVIIGKDGKGRSKIMDYTKDIVERKSGAGPRSYLVDAKGIIEIDGVKHIFHDEADANAKDVNSKEGVPMKNVKGAKSVLLNSSTLQSIIIRIKALEAAKIQIDPKKLMNILYIILALSAAAAIIAYQGYDILETIVKPGLASLLGR